MTETGENQRFRRIVSILILVSGLFLAIYTVARLRHGPFPFSETKIVKVIIGLCLALLGWIVKVPQKPELVYRSLLNFLLPPVREQSYPRAVRMLLTFLMCMGISMTIWGVSKHFAGVGAGFLHRSPEMVLGGLVLALTAGVLRYGRKSVCRSVDWPKPMELFLVFGLALAVIATDIYFSSKIGLLAYPPYYDGVEYMLHAKMTFLQLGLWKLHPITLANMIFANRYPLWQSLMILNFEFFGEGEWQAYAVRFWPTFLILLAVFWVVRHRVGTVGAWAAVVFTSLLPTLNLNLTAAATKQRSTFHNYLTDLRPDLLFAAFLLCAVVLLVENARSFEEATALLSGTCAALAVLTKASASGALLLAWCIAWGYVFIIHRRNWRNVLPMAAWALLAFTVLLLPWALAGGAEMTFQYVRAVMTTELPLYSNPHATLRTEMTYYWNWFEPHMGLIGLACFGSGAVAFLVLLTKKGLRECETSQLLAYLVAGAALYGLVSASLAKNYFLGLPCYLLLWIFSLSSLAIVINMAQAWKSRLTRGLTAIGVVYASFVGITGYYNLLHWPSYELQEGPYNRAVMREIAGDLRKILSDDDTFMWMPAYGSPSTLLYYMPMPKGRLPQSIPMDAETDPSPDQYAQEFMEPAKAVLLYREDIEEVATFCYVHPANYPYFRAVAKWIHRSGSSHHLFKSYRFFGNGDNPGQRGLNVDLYVRDSTAVNPSPEQEFEQESCLQVNRKSCIRATN